MPHDIWAEGYTDAKSIPDDVLFTRIAQTVEWCESLINSSDFKPAMRSSSLSQTIVNSDDPFSYEFDLTKREKTVCDVGRTRSTLFEGQIEKQLNFPKLFDGRLLVYFLDDDMQEGNSELESDGFFDINSLPPWDTWIALFKDEDPNRSYETKYLLAYVSEYSMALAAEGILFNMLGSIDWLEDKPEIFLHQRLKPYLDIRPKHKDNLKTVKSWWQFWKYSKSCRAPHI